MPKPPKEDGGVFQCLNLQADFRIKLHQKPVSIFRSVFLYPLTLISILVYAYLIVKKFLNFFLPLSVNAEPFFRHLSGYQ